MGLNKMKNRFMSRPFRFANKNVNMKPDNPKSPELPYEDLSELYGERDKRLKELEATENQLRGSLQRKTQDVGTAIDQELMELTQKVGYDFGQKAQTTAGVASERGVLRSSFAGEQMSELAAQEMGQQAQLQADARSKKYAVSEAARKTLDDIATRRQQLAAAVDAQEIADKIAYNQSVTVENMQNRWKEELMKVEQDEAKRGAIGGLLGGLVGGVAGFFVGGPMGAAVGAGVGSQAGRSVAS